ncbi:MAG: recombinase family protein [Candidatus Bathyarchaeota archaeon]|nr:recombinase family protein [Candidatus Bathyarchaeota archaeon]
MNNTEIIGVGGYARISTDEIRQRYSLPAQEKRIREYVASRRQEGYRLHRIYSDQASATNLNRPALKELLGDAEHHIIRAVMVVKMDRLCRNLADQLYLTDLLKEWEVRLEATDEDLDLESVDGITWAHIRGAINEAESRRNSERTKKAMRERAAQGGWCGGYTPFGYRYDKATKGIIPHSDEASIIQKVFHLYTERRLGAKSIAMELSARGLRTRSGIPFSASWVLNLLTNPVYVGKIRWDGEIFSGVHRALITENQFAKAQEILAERRDNPSLRRSNGSDYPLSGLLRCVRCGKGLVGASAHGRNRVYSYYACSEKLKSGECDLESLPKERIERAIIDQIKRIFLNRKLIEGLLERVRAKQANNLPKKQAEMINYEKQIRHKKELINRYLGAFESGTLDQTLCGQRLRNIAEELKLLEQQMTQVKEDVTQNKYQPITFEDVWKAVSKLEEVISGARVSEKRTLLRKVIKTIKVHSPNRIQPYYQIPAVRIISGVAPRTLQLWELLLLHFPT